MTELSLSNYSNIPTIPFDQIRDLLHDTEHNVSREDWTVLRFDNPFVDRPLEFIKQLDDLSKILKFRTKDSENYGEKYKAISIQKDYVKSQVKEADYDSVDANSFAQNLDAVNSKPLYFTPWGFIPNKAFTLCSHALLSSSVISKGITPFSEQYSINSIPNTSLLYKSNLIK